MQGDIIHLRAGVWHIPATIDLSKPLTLEMFGGAADGRDCTKAWQRAHDFTRKDKS